MNRCISLFLVIILISACTVKSPKQVIVNAEKSGITADSGMVVSANLLSSLVGIKILQKGGNAIDAAVATEFALAVCFPEAGNIGGGGFMVIRTNDGKSDVIDYREKAPLLASRNMFLDKSGNVKVGLSTGTHLASGVPGTVDGLITAHSRYGKLSFKDVIQPSIDLAENGFILTREQAEDFNSNRSKFVARNSGKTAFVKDSLWKEGEIMIQKDLSETLKRIRDYGRDGFYSGRTAHLLLREMKKGNGIMSERDLSEYKSVLRVPLYSDYKGYKIITVPPPSSGGIILLQLLGMVEPFPIREWGFNSIQTIHLMVEAERRAFADRSEFMGDPESMIVTVNQLVNKKYLINRMSNYNKNEATPSSQTTHGYPEQHESEETTHYSVVDSKGNAVSVTTTLNDTFGNSIVVDSAGFLLNNQMDDFSVKPGVPNMYGLVGGDVNSIQPGKKMLSSMTPAIVEKDGKLFLVVGSPGGSTIPTSVFQVIVNVLDFGMSLEEAVDAARFHHQWLPELVYFEKNRIDSLAYQKLTNMGYELKVRSSIGRVNAIMLLPDGKKVSGADKRGNNSACGY